MGHQDEDRHSRQRDQHMQRAQNKTKLCYIHGMLGAHGKGKERRLERVRGKRGQGRGPFRD